MSAATLLEKIQEQLDALQGSWILQCVIDHGSPEPLDADTVPGYDVVVGEYRLSLRKQELPRKYLSSYDPVNITTNLEVDDKAPKLLKLYAEHLNRKTDETWLAVLEELVQVENKLNKKEKKMLKLHWDLRIEKLNDSNPHKGVVLGDYVLSITNAPSFYPGYKLHCPPVPPKLDDGEIFELVRAGKITELEAAVLEYSKHCGNPTSATVGELEAALEKAGAEWFAMEQEIKHIVGQMQLHWHAGVTDNKYKDPVKREVIRQPINDTQWFVLSCMDPIAFHPKGFCFEPPVCLGEVLNEHLGVVAGHYLDIVNVDPANPRSMKRYHALVKQIWALEKAMDQSKPADTQLGFTQVDDVTVKIESLRSKLKYDWLFQIVDAGTPDHAIWPEANMWCRDSLSNGSDLAILYRPKGEELLGFLKIGGHPFQQFHNATITNRLTEEFLNMIGRHTTNVPVFEKTPGYVDLLEAVLEQETKMGQGWSTEGASHQHSLKLNPTPTAYSYLVVFQDLMAPQSTVLGADWVGSFEIKPLYNVAVYRAPSESFALMFTLDGNVRVDALEAGAKGTGLAAQLSKLAVAHLGHTTLEWRETTKLLRACFE